MALCRLAWALANARPGRSLPCSCVGGFSLGENALGHQIGKLLVAGVAQEKRLAAVADENESVMGNSELVHVGLLADEARLRGGAA